MPNRYFPLVFLLVEILFSSSRLFGASGRSLHLDFGGYQNHLEQKSDAPSGFEDKVSSRAGYLRLRGNLPLGINWIWEPSVGTLVPWKSGVDGNSKKFTTHINFTFSYPLISWLRFRLGPGVKWVFAFSDGGPIELNNGISTSTFYSAGYPSHSLTFSAQSGLSVLLSSRISLNVDVYGSGLLNKLRRNFDAAMTLGWRL